MVTWLFSCSHFFSHHSMSKATAGPDLTKYMDKTLELQLTGRRKIRGTLRGFDQFMNIVLESSQVHSNALPLLSLSL